MDNSKKIVDEKLIQRLAEIQCTQKEIAFALEVSEAYISTRFSDKIADWREAGKASLRRKQWEKAMDGHVGMLIWLGKQYLGQSDKQTIDQTFDTFEVIIGSPDNKNRPAVAGATEVLELGPAD